MNSNITSETIVFNINNYIYVIYKVKEQMFIFQGGKNGKLSGDLNT